MAEPGAPKDPQVPDDHDDLVGFSTPASLAGRPREEAQPARPASPARAAREPEPDLFDPSPEAVAASSPPEPTPETGVAAAPVSAGSVFAPSEFSTRARGRGEPADLPNGGTGLFTGYALILFAVPTLGVSVIVGLLAIISRAVPSDDLSRSHHLYQRRTLFAAAVAAVVGLVLIAAPFALGVPVLFLLAIWVILRGAAGVMALKSGRPIRNPSGWWI